MLPMYGPDECNKITITIAITHYIYSSQLKTCLALDLNNFGFKALDLLFKEIRRETSLSRNQSETIFELVDLFTTYTKVNLAIEQAMKAQTGSTGMALPFL
jgi:hypothetical protein